MNPVERSLYNPNGSAQQVPGTGQNSVVRNYAATYQQQGVQLQSTGVVYNPYVVPPASMPVVPNPYAMDPNPYGVFSVPSYVPQPLANRGVVHHHSQPPVVNFQQVVPPPQQRGFNPPIPLSMQNQHPHYPQGPNPNVPLSMQNNPNNQRRFI